MSEGYTPATGDELKRAETEYEYGGVKGAAIAGGTGLARGATLGLSDAALAGLGGKEVADAIAASRELHGGISMGSELAGALIPALASGGSSTAATGAELAATGAREASMLSRGLSAGGRLLTAPARLQTGLGSMAERGAAGMFRSEGGGLLSRAAEKMVPDIARGIAEGGLQGVGNSITESALGDHKLTAEDVIANIGHGALLGGALGGGIGALRFGAGEARQGLGRLLAGRSSVVQEAAPEFAGTFRHADEMTATGGGATLTGEFKLGDVYNVAHDLDPEIRAALKNPELRAIMQRDTAKEADRLSMIAKDAYNEGQRATREMEQGVFYGAAKDAQMRKLVNEANAPAAVQRAQDLVDAAKSLRDVAEADILKYPASYTKRLSNLIDGYEVKLRAGVMPEQEGHVAGNMFTLLDDFKHDLGKLAKGAPGQAGQSARQLYKETFMEGLQDEAVWGKAALSQKTINPAIHTNIGHGREASKLVEFTTGAEDYIDTFEKLMEANPAKFKTAFQGIGTADSYATMKTLTLAAQAQRELADAAVKSYTLTPHQQGLVAKMRASAEKYEGLVKEAEKNMGLIRKAAESEATSVNPLAKVAEGIPGVGPVLSFALATNPVTIARRTDAVLNFTGRMKTLLGIKSAADATRKTISDAAAKIVRTVPDTETAISNVGNRFTATSAAVKLFGRDPAERRKSYGETRDRILEAATNPARSRSAVASIAADAPGVASQMSSALQAQAKYLVGKLPVERPASLLQPNVRPVTASDGQIDTFARHLAAVESPAETLAAIARGTATPEAVQAYRDSYPSQFAEVQRQVMAHIAEMDAKGEELPYASRVKVSILLGVPADQSLRPEFIQTIQATYGVAKQQAAQQAAAMTAPANSGAKMRADRFASAADNIEGGKLGE
jgi:hypothetical protein